MKIFKRSSSFLLILLLITSLPLIVMANSEKSVSELDVVKTLDPAYGYDFAHKLSKLGYGTTNDTKIYFRIAGSKADAEGEKLIADEMKSIGLQNVTIDEIVVDGWDFTNCSMKIVSPNEESIDISPYPGTPGISTTSQLVYVAGGTKADYLGKDVKGKIVIAEFDPNTDYWYTAPAYEAKINGAVALIVVYTGESIGADKDVLNAFDPQINLAMPIFNVSINNGQKLKALLGVDIDQKATQNKVDIKLFSDAKITPKATSSNVFGMILGKNPDQYVILGSHRDAHFNGFVDNGFGTGILLSVAKSMIDSGYQPDKTIIFIAHGAEEFGANIFCDWAVGSWQAISKNHPEWIGNTVAYLDIDGVRSDTSFYLFQATPELVDFMSEYAKRMVVTNNKDEYEDKDEFIINLLPLYKDGTKIITPQSTVTDNISYSFNGVPSLDCSSGNAKESIWRYSLYHTTKDTYEDAIAFDNGKLIFDDRTNQEYPIQPFNVFSFNTENYVRLAIAFDQIGISPLNLGSDMQSFSTSLDLDFAKANNMQKEAIALKDDASKFAIKAKTYFEKLTVVNTLYKKIINNKSSIKDKSGLASFEQQVKSENSTALRSYKLLQDNLYKFNFSFEILFGHDLIETNLASLDKTILALQAKDGQIALKELLNVDNTAYVPLFSKEVFTYSFVEFPGPEQPDLNFSSGKVKPYLNTYDIYYAIEKKLASKNSDYTAEINILKEMKATEIDLLKKYINQEHMAIKESSNLLNAKNLDEIISLGNILTKDI